MERNPLGIDNGARVKIVGLAFNESGPGVGLTGYIEQGGDCFYYLRDRRGKDIWYGYTPTVKILDPRGYRERFFRFAK